MLRISRGPWRAPARLVVPPSHGTPIRRDVELRRVAARCGSRMKVGMRAEARHQSGIDRLRVVGGVVHAGVTP